MGQALRQILVILCRKWLKGLGRGGGGGASSADSDIDLSSALTPENRCSMVSLPASPLQGELP